MTDLKKFSVGICVWCGVLLSDASALYATPITKNLPAILNPALRYQKARQLEISVSGGNYLGATLGQTWMVGSRVFYHLSNAWALGGEYGYAHPSFGIGLQSASMHIANLECMFSSDAAIRVAQRALEMDFFITTGVGAMHINNTWEPDGLIGGGVKFYPGPSWLAVRIDVNNYAHYTTQTGAPRFDFDVTFQGGISILLPPHHHISPAALSLGSLE